MRLHLLFAAAFLLAGSPLQPALAVDDFKNPEITTGTVTQANREAVVGKRYMISAANPLAVRAGEAILRTGGGAIDAAIATQLVLNVVEPQSSGIGGGGFLLYWDAAEKKLYAYDGRETAPMAADETLFLDDDGQPLAFMEAVQGGRSVGVPGLLKMLELAHKRHGHVEWPRLFTDAIRLSREGFALSPRLHNLLSNTPRLRQFPESIQPYLTESGTLKSVGERVENKPLSETLSTLALKGPTPFYQGEIATALATAVQSAEIHPGTLTQNDLKHYKVKEREPVCAPYRTYRICSMPPPSSGGVTILQALTILEKLQAIDIRASQPLSTDAVHAFAEASKLAYADRNRYLADPDFEDVPVKAMLDPTYLAERAATIRRDRAMEHAEAGELLGEDEFALLTTEEHPSTTHISVIDASGNAVAMTTSIEQGFGSGLSVRGFLLNNQLTDFSFSPTLPDGVSPHPNRVEPGKRPRSSMSPSMVFDKNGTLVMVIGSPGGARIIEYVAQTLIAVLDWQLDIQQAINLPHYLNMNGPTELEAGTRAVALESSLKARGHQVRVMESPSGLHGITRFDGVLKGGADPRREGIAMGQ